MGNVVVEPIDSFIHGEFHARKGIDMPMDSSTASDLERAGLVRIKGTPQLMQTPQQQLDLKTAAGKAQSDGPGQPSLSSPVAPVSQTKTAKPSAAGGAKGPTKGK